eukprot:CAMPEP_0198294158 /NCGR_PEP_ID=MMETSP1449-20131203/21148_1 /TAXON_ID=420275 /ORGANISM="Attheya septentrionalis, Strain CCMP2084" /LENGTH=310 /DNA_ID=CAMNT_0043994033 /DNA_START=71 /DNA_END=1003 /DNA_ORIENTATION=+
MAMRQRRILSSSSSSSSSSSEEQFSAASLVQGPSLLKDTGVERPNPSLFLLPGLRSLAFWSAPAASTNAQNQHRIAYGDPHTTRAVQLLEDNFADIQAEYLARVVGMSNHSGAAPNPRPLESDYDTSKHGGEHANDALHTGTWDWHSHLLGGVVQPRFAKEFPKTAAVLRTMEKEGLLFSTTPFSFAFFSTLYPESTIKPHFGPMNLRLRIHLPLLVPPPPPPATTSSSGDPTKSNEPLCGIRVGSQVRTWEEGKALVLDDAFEHEVWNRTSDLRVVLLLDIWHPDVSPTERTRIGTMFDYAKTQGWLKT